MAAMPGPATAQPATQDPLSGAVPTLAPSDVHVLLVDDERLSRVVVGNVLRKCNYRVTVAESGSEAVSLLRAHPPGTFHLVLTDVMMPDVDGIELLRFLRGNDAFAAVPVVMMSANEENDTVFECIRGGAEDYLLKPVTRKEVQHIWQHVWRRQQQLVVPSIQDEVDDLRRLSGQASVPLAASDPPSVSAVRSESGELAPRSAAGAAAASDPAAVSKATGGGPAAAAGAAAAPPQQWLSQLQRQSQQLQQQTQQRQRQQQPRQQQPQAAPPAQAQMPAQLPPSRPLAEFLSASGPHRQHSGEEAFRVLCQVLGFLRAAHSRGAALGRLRPSGLRVTASCVVLMDPGAQIPAEEEELYAAPEELFARARPAASVASSDAGNAVSATAAGRAGRGASASVSSSGSMAAVPAAGATGRAAAARPADGGRPGAGLAGGPVAAPQRTPAGDMFSLGLLLLQLLHPVDAHSRAGGNGSDRRDADEGAAPDEAEAAAAARAQRVLRDARHQILPTSLLQGRPAEAALLTALLNPDPKRRPAIDDVLRSGLLRKLHSGLTRPPAAPATQSGERGSGGNAAAAAAPSAAAGGPAVSTAAAGAAAKLGPVVRQGAAGTPAAQPPATAAAAQPSARPALPQPLSAALATQLGGSGALQDFLALARDAAAADAAALTKQLSIMDQDARAVERCLAAVQAQAAALAARRAAAACRKHATSEQVAPSSSPTAASKAASASLRTLSAPAVPRTAPSQLATQPRSAVAATPDEANSPDAGKTPDAAAAAAAAVGQKRLREEAGGAAAAPAAGSSPRGFVSSPGGSPVAATASGGPVLQPTGATAVKARRVAASLPAVDAAFFRAREAADAGSDTEGSQLSPSSQQAAAFRSLQAALQPWQPGTSDAVLANDPTRLPPHLDAFGRDLDCFSRHGDFRVVSHLKYGDGLACPEFVCSVDFDRDDEFFATAGVSRRVKVYEYASLLDDGGAATGGAHYPVLDLPFRSKLAAVAWNTYLKSHLLAADYAGIATLVDASAGVEVAAFAEHSKRVWSIDFSATDPQRFLSGSDDGTVRLWSINEPSAAAAIDAKANVCSVQFSPTDANLMAFGAANYRTYLYDLRTIKSPLAVIGGHSRAVSYVRFLACGRRLLTASTDSALKLWDIAAEVTRPPGQPAAPQLTYTGHVNEKNFVGLSVSPAGYIATGSEDNSVVAYHSSMPVPIARHYLSEQQPGSTAPGVYGAPPRPQQAMPTGDSAMQPFVSSVTWTRAGGACVASNSQGHLRVLELV